jgi:Putative Tad-like Flp pilus-assembly
VTSGCTTSGCSTGGPQEAPARQQAETVGGLNFVGGQAVTIPPRNISFSYPMPYDPQITVVVQQTVPTFFMRVFGVQSESISASATAEAYNPSSTSGSTTGGSTGPNIAAQCVKPWLLPNCDLGAPAVPLGPQANTNCPTAGGYYPYILYPPGSPNAGQLVNSSSLGELLTLKPGQPNSAPAPSQYYAAYLNPGTAGYICPSCANGGGGGGNGVPSGNTYQENIECCNQNVLSCGLNNVQPIVGNKVGPTSLGVDCLIHQQGGGSGQDILSGASTLPTGSLVPPFTITGGSANPDPALVGQNTNGRSDSLVNVALYDGSELCPGMATCPTLNVTVQGFLQLFIKDEGSPQGTVRGYIYSLAGCNNSTNGSGGGSSGGTITTTGGALIPVRLIHN